MEQPQPRAPSALLVGASVEVLSRFDQRWKSGFEVADVDDGAYRIRRRSDGSVLPTCFAPTQVRATSAGLLDP